MAGNWTAGAVCVAVLLAGCLAPAATPGGGDGPTTDAQGLSRTCPQPRAATPFEHQSIREASGITRSVREPCLFWVHDDSGAPPVLYAVDGAGRHIAEAWIEAHAVDWEDITSFSFDGVPYLLVADVGNNGAARSTTSVLVFREPDLSAEQAPANVSVHDVVPIVIRYPAAPFDIEAVAVDADADEILFISKGETRLAGAADPSGPNQALYTATLSHALQERDVTLKFRTLIAGIRPGPGDPLSEYRFGIGGGLVTGMDLRPDRAEIALLTYREILVWLRTSDESWAQALGGVPRAVTVADPGKDQMEGLAYSHDARCFLVVDEQGDPNSEVTVLSAWGRG